ncbi:MAG: hypothetical protein A2283_02265 [Lentisphaerae bacterium RIFOXYA12_FULL_48_11]|nr:MAG: hypothetical protein A2283_02265 [Lentisphaerae bacterium RIFOXYA12_FULL_48_11]
MNVDISIGKATNTPNLTATSRDESNQRILKEACKEFEGVLTGIILKDALKTESMDEDSATGEEIFREYAAEQTARDLGQKESLGIARMLYEQLSGGHNVH